MPSRVRKENCDNDIDRADRRRSLRLTELEDSFGIVWGTRRRISIFLFLLLINFAREGIDSASGKTRGGRASDCFGSQICYRGPKNKGHLFVSILACFHIQGVKPPSKLTS